jgi:hypothetical protein
MGTSQILSVKDLQQRMQSGDTKMEYSGWGYKHDRAKIKHRTLEVTHFKTWTE